MPLSSLSLCICIVSVSLLLVIVSIMCFIIVLVGWYCVYYHTSSHFPLLTGACFLPKAWAACQKVGDRVWLTIYMAYIVIFLQLCSDVTKTLVPRPRHQIRRPRPKHQMKITFFTWSGNSYRKRVTLRSEHVTGKWSTELYFTWSLWELKLYTAEGLSSFLQSKFRVYYSVKVY